MVDRTHRSRVPAKPPRRPSARSRTGCPPAVNPVGNAIAAVRDSDSRHDRIAQLEHDNTALKAKLGSGDRNRSRLNQLDKMLKMAGAGQYGIKGAEVIAIGAAQGFSWTVTIDVGSKDGIQRDMTVLNGDGLVGRVTTVGPDTATVLLANDPDFTVGTRMESSDELGFASGQGDRPLRVEMLNGKAKIKRGNRWSPWAGRQALRARRPGRRGVPCRPVRRRPDPHDLRHVVRRVLEARHRRCRRRGPPQGPT